ncbi:hypothetical protein [Nocardia wallacei]|uniref:hypothetical protein n=1 Tax=Nocardia wallacei TaxID=480035 RepID=UPI00245778FA|nr:hypothetical protein [Nocardia wallacei]
MVRYADRKARIRLVSRHVGVGYTEAQRLLDATPADPEAARWILPSIDAQICRRVVQNRYEQLLAAAIADLAAAVPPMPAVIRLGHTKPPQARTPNSYPASTSPSTDTPSSAPPSKQPACSTSTHAPPHPANHPSSTSEANQNLDDIQLSQDRTIAEQDRKRPDNRPSS